MVAAPKRGMAAAVLDQPEAETASPPMMGLPRGSDMEDIIVAPGRELAHIDIDPPATGLGQNLIRRFYAATTLFPGLRNPFARKQPLRLLAAPVDPVIGDAAEGMAIRAGHFLYQGMKAPLSELDFAALRLPPSFVRYLHGFRWLRDLEASGARDQATPLAMRLTGNWIDANAGKSRGPAFDTQNIGCRLLFWSCHAPLILGADDRDFRTRFLAEYDRNAALLDRLVQRDGQGINGLFGWAGVIAAGLMLPGGDNRRIFGEAGLSAAVRGFVGGDGGVMARAPILQMDAIMVITMLRAIYRASDAPEPEFLGKLLAAMVPALQGLVHNDGSLGNWQGAGGTAAETVQALIDASEVRARPLRQAPHWGYQRVPAGPLILLADAAPPPLPRDAINGCASTLAIEISHGASRLIVNCGGASLVGPLIPERLAQGLRTTAAHSTLCLNDRNSTAVLSLGRLGKGVTEVELERREIDNATRLEMAHDGYAQRYGYVHRRILMVRNDGDEVRGDDMLVPIGKKAPRRQLSYAIRFHLGAGVEAHASEDGKAALLRTAEGQIWQLRSALDAVKIEESLWVDGKGRPHPTQQVVISGDVERGGGTYGWIIKRMG